MRSFIVGLVAATALAAPAAAQDADLPFDGPYVGAHIGAALIPNDTSDTLQFSRGGAPFSGILTNSAGVNAFPAPSFCNGAATSQFNRDCRNDEDNVEYGVRLGLDKRLGRFVVGVVGEFGRNRSVDSDSAFSSTPAQYTITRDLKWNANVRLRAGIVPSDNAPILFYATGGGAYGQFRTRFYSNNTLNSYAFDGRHGEQGWVAGGGVEALAFGRVSLGLEYLYSRYNDEGSNITVSQGTAPATNPFVLGGTTTVIRPANFQFNNHNIRLTASFRF